MTIINIFCEVFRNRSAVFFVIFLLFLNVVLIFYYPIYIKMQQIQMNKQSFAEQFNTISEIINADRGGGKSVVDRLIAYIKYNSDLRYLVFPDSVNPIIYPKGFGLPDRIEKLPVNEINTVNDQKILSLKIRPEIKFNYPFETFYAGMDAGPILNKYNRAQTNAFLLFIVSIFILFIYLAVFSIDLRKITGGYRILDLGRPNADYDKKIPQINDDSGVLQLKSRLVLRKRELKSINNILAATIKSQRNFIKVVSHDLKAPLRNVSGLVDSIHRKYQGDLNPDISNRLNRIKKNVDKEHEVISDVLRDISNHEKILEYEKIDMQKIIDSITEDLEFEIQSKHIEIRIDNPLPVVYSNRIVLKHVFQNLLDNACKYFPENGNNLIRIGYHEADSEQIFSVMDTGPGIPKELQKTLFNPYEYGQPSSAYDSSEGGLGLQLVSTFMEIINGKIWFESELGKGSIFYISLNKMDDTKAGIFQ